MKNKSSIISLMLLFIFAFSPAYARLCIDQNAMKLRRENDIASYATTYLGYYGEQEKNPQKCVAMLKLIEDNERAKLFLAYCYEEGKKIAEAMIPIIEKEPVLLESILGRKIKITVDVNYESVY